MNRYTKIVIVLSLAMGGTCGLFLAAAARESLFNESIRETTDALGPPNAILIDTLLFAAGILVAVLSVVSIVLVLRHWRKP